MEIFICVMIGILSVESLIKLYEIGSNNISQRTPANVAWSIFISVLIIIWGLFEVAVC